MPKFAQESVEVVHKLAETLRDAALLQHCEQLHCELQNQSELSPSRVPLPSNSASEPDDDVMDLTKALG